MTKALEPWSPFSGLERFRRDFDEMVDRFLGGGMGDFLSEQGAPRLESFVEGDKLMIRADLPGIDPKDVDVTVNGSVLTLRGKRERTHEDKGRNYLHREVFYGSFERSLTLPDGVKAEDVKASYKNGVLELTMPVPKGMTARKVPIEIESSGRKAIEKQG
jgi:HSP20 family protein